MPQGKHSRLQGRFVTTINQFAEAEQIAQAFPELRCNFGGRSIVPDVSVFSWSRISLNESGDVANVFEAAPDWTIEILSPEQNQTRVTNNILHRLNHGCKMGWLVDPDERSILVYPASKQPQFFHIPEAKLPIPALLDKLELAVGQIFGWLQLANR